MSRNIFRFSLFKVIGYHVAHASMQHMIYIVSIALYGHIIGTESIKRHSSARSSSTVYNTIFMHVLTKAFDFGFD